MLPSTITLRSATTTNVRGLPERTYADTSRRASVQETSSQERDLHGLEEDEKLFNVFFAAPDPGVKRGDLIVVPGRGTLTCLGRAEDTAGFGVLYKVRARGQS